MCVLQIEVVYTGGCSAEHLIGSTNDKGSWLDGLLLRRLRALVEGACGSGHAGDAHSRHRACGVGTGDVCPPLAGKATSGFSHGCKSRLLVLDGPISRVLEGMIAGDHAGAPPLTGPQVKAYFQLFSALQRGSLGFSQCPAHFLRYNPLGTLIGFHPPEGFGASYMSYTSAGQQIKRALLF